MCLSTIRTRKEKAKWIERQPQNIILYKIVKLKEVEGEDRFFPMFFGNNNPFEKTNKISRFRRWFPKTVKTYYAGNTIDWKRTRYRAYYHFFMKEADAYGWGSVFGVLPIVLKCIVNKKDITAIGQQKGSKCIVAKEFIFQTNEHFEEEAKCA